MARSTPPPPPAEVPETIVDVDVSAEMESSFLEYAYSVIYSRAIPDARDGLKPVQRRILFAMAEMGLRPDRGHVKSSRVVGDVMGKYHPHGDTAIYDAMVRMAQPFSLRLPLIDGHGNFGSLDAGPAAARYTEARLAPAALAMTDGLDEDVVDLVPNYDNTMQQPAVLPAAIPNLLVNGAFGVAVGMATNIPPHNLVEVIEAVRYLIAHPGASVDKLMTFVLGPDLPTGGRITGLDGIRQAYADDSGQGRFVMRATVATENVTARRKGLVVTELPHMVGTEKVITRIKEGAQAKKLDGISAVTDLSDRRHGLRLVIELKAGFNPDAVLERLYKVTPLEESFSMNMVTLVEGQPRTLGLRQLLQVFIDHRLEVTRRRSEFRLAKARDRLHLVDGLLIAILDIDLVIAIIRGSDNAETARTVLIEAFSLSVPQAEYILELRLRRLTKFSRIELEEEQGRLREQIAELERLLADEDLLRRLVSTELAAIAKEHGTPRRTVLLEGPAAVPKTSAATPLEVADDPCWVLLSASGRLARTTTREPLPERDRRAAHDVLTSVVASSARGEVAALTNRGRAYRVPIIDVPTLPATAGPVSLAGGTSVEAFVELDKGERVIGIASATPQAGDSLLLGTARGVVKRVVPEVPGTRESWELITLQDKDEVVGAVEIPADREALAHVVFVTSDAQLLHFPATVVRPQGRGAAGMAGIRLAAGARVIWAGVVDPTSAAELVTVTELDSDSGTLLPGPDAGTAKVTPFTEYPAKGRGTGGVRCHRLLRGETGLAVAWVGQAPARATGPDGKPVPLPGTTARRDGSGTPLTGPVRAGD